MNIQNTDTAVVFIDPQNDVLSEKGSSWGAVGASVSENHAVKNMERIFKAAKANAYEVFISPHYFYPTDSGWKFNGPLVGPASAARRCRPSGKSSSCWPRPRSACHRPRNAPPTAAP